MLRPGGAVYVSTPNLLTLAPPGRGEVGQPLAPARVPRRGVPRALRERLRAASSCSASSTRASCALHELALRAGWDRVHAGARHHEALLRPLHAGHLRARLRAARRAARARARLRRGAPRLERRRAPRARSRSCCTRTCPTWRASAPGRSARSGSGRPWRASTCRCSTLLDGAPVTVGLTPVLCDQLEAMRGEPASATCASCARSARRSTPRTPPASTRRRARAGGRGAPRGGRLHARGARLRGARPRPPRRLRARSSGVELWTSAATHALLPLIATDAGLRLQLATGTASHLRRFGGWGGGFWLPECAYVPGLERELADARRARVLRRPDRAWPASTTSCRSPPRPGPVAVPIDWETVELVWNDERRLPGSRRLPRLLPPHGPRPEAVEQRRASPTTTSAALALAREHARDFVAPGGGAARATAACSAARSTPSCSGTGGTRGRPGSRAVLEEAEAQGVRLVTRVGGDRAGGAGGSASSPPSTWGHGKDFTTWDAPAVAELAFAARAAELRTVAAVAAHGAPHAALERAARELLAMQASDWAFMVTRDLAADYPAERMRLHGAALDAALAALTDSAAAPGARRCAAWRRTSTSPPDHSVDPNARPDPVLGVPAADRGRPRAPRAQAGGEPGGPGRGRARARARPRGGPAGGGGGRRARPPRARARAPARPRASSSPGSST